MTGPVRFLLASHSLLLSWGAGGLIGGYLYLKPGLPDVESLRTVQLQTPLQIFTSDGQLIAQFGEKRRDPVSINEVPLDLVRAFLAAEDDNFRDHVGIDPLGLARARVAARFKWTDSVWRFNHNDAGSKELLS